jgi:hypothetical protein
MEKHSFDLTVGDRIDILQLITYDGAVLGLSAQAEFIVVCDTCWWEIGKLIFVSSKFHCGPALFMNFSFADGLFHRCVVIT